MAKVIALIQQQGRRSASTSVFNLGWMLAEHGQDRYRWSTQTRSVTLTGLVLDSEAKQTGFEDYYVKHPLGNLKEASRGLRFSRDLGRLCQ